MERIAEKRGEGGGGGGGGGGSEGSARKHSGRKKWESEAMENFLSDSKRRGTQWRK